MIAKIVTGLGATLLVGSWATVVRADNPPLANIGMAGVGVGLLTTVAGVLAWVL